ncbi:MAG: trigger factor family protein [Woeseiaceae bacterium]|nr:trigger factor family protein [Woeseiaceae bacterium]
MPRRHPCGAGCCRGRCTVAGNGTLGPVPGFRPGRAPLAVLRGRHGQRVRGVVVDRMAIDVARRLINEQRLEPIGRPTIHIDEDAAALPQQSNSVSCSEVFPQIEIMPFTGIRLKRLRPPPGISVACRFVRNLFAAPALRCL